MPSEQGDLCKQCGSNGMPKWTGKETARACQNCGWVEEKPDRMRMDFPDGSSVRLTPD